MEQYIYTYLNQKYGLKNLIIEWFVAIINGIQVHQNDDHDIRLFGKILKNECDEEFRFIQMHVKDTLQSLLRVLLRDKYQFKGEAEISRMLEHISTINPATQLGRGDIASSKGQSQLNILIKDQGMQLGVIEEWMWRRIIEKMYDYVDAVELEDRFLQQIAMRDQVMNYYISTLSENQLLQFMTQNKIAFGANRKVTRDDLLAFIKKH